MKLEIMFGPLRNVERDHAYRADDGCARTVNLP